MASQAPPLSRRALYVRVWSTPVTELAKEFGIAGTALTAACRRHGIPTPRPGYWIKKEFGKTVEQPPLEDLDGMSAETEVEFPSPKAAKPKTPETKAPRLPASPASAITQLPPEPLNPATEIPQGGDLDLHPTLDATRKKLLAPIPDGDLARASGKGTFSVSAGSAQAPRALLFLSRLLRAMDAQGWSVARSETGLQLCPDGEAVSFTLTEQTDRIPHKVTDAEREARTRFEAKRAAAARRGDWFGAGDPPQIPDWDYRPAI